MLPGAIRQQDDACVLHCLIRVVQQRSHNADVGIRQMPDHYG